MFCKWLNVSYIAQNMIRDIWILTKIRYIRYIYQLFISHEFQCSFLITAPPGGSMIHCSWFHYHLLYLSRGRIKSCGGLSFQQGPTPCRSRTHMGRGVRNEVLHLYTAHALQVWAEGSSADRTVNEKHIMLHLQISEINAALFTFLWKHISTMKRQKKVKKDTMAHIKTKLWDAEAVR